jgi:hypothetical protein
MANLFRDERGCLSSNAVEAKGKVCSDDGEMRAALGECVSPNLQVQGDGALLALSDLKLHRIALVQVFDLSPRRQAAAVKKHIFGAIVRRNKTESLLSNDFFYRPCHTFLLCRESLL